MAEIMAMNIPVITNRGWGDVEGFESYGITFGLSQSGELRDLDESAFIKQTLNKKKFIDEFSIARGILDYQAIYLALTQVE